MNPYRKGLFSGLLSGILWGADTTINGWVLLAVPFSLVDKRLVAASLLEQDILPAFPHYIQSLQLF